MAGGHHDASSCSTAGSEQSDKKKRLVSSYDEDPNFKPYECRFCPMKFAKSQALGGHMNRHRQEREREQLMNARQLLMQQEFSPTLMMSGQSPQSPLPKLSQSHIQRSTSDHCLKDGILMGASSMTGSIGRGFLQSNPFNHSLSAPSLNWSLASGLESAQSSMPTFNLDGMIPSYQASQAYSTALNSSTSSFIMQQPLHRALNQHDGMMISTSSDKSTQLSMFPFDPNNPTLQRGESLYSQHTQQNRSQEGSILTGSLDMRNFMSATNSSFLHQRSNELGSQQELSQALSLQSEPSNMATMNNGLHFVPFPSNKEEVRPPLSTSQSTEFNLGLGNPLDGTLSWLHKSTSTLNALLTSTSNQQELENTKPKVDESVISVSSGPIKAMRWDLELQALQSQDDPNINIKVRELAPDVGELSTSPFEDDFSNDTANLDGQPTINKPN